MIRFYFRIYLILHTCAARFDGIGNLENFLHFGMDHKSIHCGQSEAQRSSGTARRHLQFQYAPTTAPPRPRFFLSLPRPRYPGPAAQRTKHCRSRRETSTRPRSPTRGAATRPPTSTASRVHFPPAPTRSERQRSPKRQKKKKPSRPRRPLETVEQFVASRSPPANSNGRDQDPNPSHRRGRDGQAVVISCGAGGACAGMERRELQALCKRHGLPAGGSNVDLVARLDAALSVRTQRATSVRAVILVEAPSACGNAPLVRFFLFFLCQLSCYESLYFFIVISFFLSVFFFYISFQFTFFDFILFSVLSLFFF